MRKHSDEFSRESIDYFNDMLKINGKERYTL